MEGSIEGNSRNTSDLRYPFGVHSAEDARAKVDGRKDESDCDGEGPMYAGTC